MELPDGRRFGDIRLSRLNWQDIEYRYATMRGSGKSAACIGHCATVLARAFDLARKRGLIDSNPAKDATRPARPGASPTPRQEAKFGPSLLRRSGRTR